MRGWSLGIGAMVFALVPRLQPGDIFYLWLQPHFEEATGAAGNKRFQAGAWERGKLFF